MKDIPINCRMGVSFFNLLPSWWLHAQKYLYTPISLHDVDEQIRQLGNRRRDRNVGEPFACGSIPGDFLIALANSVLATSLSRFTPYQ